MFLLIITYHGFARKRAPKIAHGSVDSMPASFYNTDMKVL